MTVLTRSLTLVPLFVVLVACASPKSSPAESIAAPTAVTSAGVCPLTEPVWIKPPVDSAVQDAPAFGYYFVNEDRSIWASAWWTGQDDYPLRATKEGIKMGWFKPAGATLAITGERIDSPAPPLEAHIPCCYPTRFQATGVFFAIEGCWRVTAKAADRELSFVVRVEP